MRRAALRANYKTALTMVFAPDSTAVISRMSLLGCLQNRVQILYWRVEPPSAAILVTRAAPRRGTRLTRWESLSIPMGAEWDGARCVIRVYRGRAAMAPCAMWRSTRRLVCSCEAIRAGSAAAKWAWRLDSSVWEEKVAAPWPAQHLATVRAFIYPFAPTGG